MTASLKSRIRAKDKLILQANPKTLPKLEMLLYISGL
jgi:hypothetical protein